MKGNPGVYEVERLAHRTYTDREVKSSFPTVYWIHTGQFCKTEDHVINKVLLLC